MGTGFPAPKSGYQSQKGPVFSPDGILYIQHFSNIGYWGCPSKANNVMLGYSITRKSENDIANTTKKPHNFVKKTKNYPKKPPSDLQKLNPDFSEEWKEERQLGMWVFYAKF